MRVNNDNLRKYLWIFIFITNLVAILLLLGSTQAWSILPSKASIFSYLGMAFPLLVVINVLYLLFWIFTLKWRYMIAEVIVLLLCWTPMKTYLPTNERSQDIPKETFRVLSYNVRHFNWLMGAEARENPIFDYILELSPDIICFQEFGAARKKNAKGLISKGEIDDIFKDYPYRDFVAIGNPNSPNLYGLAMYSKFPITKPGEALFWSAYNGCTLYELEIDGKRISLFNAHLESNRITSDDKKLYSAFLKSDKDISLRDVTSNIKARLGVAFALREEQAEIISTRMSGLDTNGTIVCGDFNDTPISYTYNTIKGDLIDSFVATGRGLGITYHENLFLFRIDYIFHSISLKSYNTTVGNQKYSDHYPVWTDLMFK